MSCESWKLKLGQSVMKCVGEGEVGDLKSPATTQHIWFGAQCWVPLILCSVAWNAHESAWNHFNVDICWNFSVRWKFASGWLQTQTKFLLHTCAQWSAFSHVTCIVVWSVSGHVCHVIHVRCSRERPWNRTYDARGAWPDTDWYIMYSNWSM